ncbi:MAG: lipid-binding SYLF domain-containing protein [Chloracidobacterium sp.]|nr:lipid-binding SYLF domain-containing protein [Chloracidobacterium sp.]
MNSKLGRSLICALCVGVVFCLATVTTPAQSYAQRYSSPGLSPLSASGGDELDNLSDGPAEVAEVFRNIAVARHEIPRDVMRNAEAVGVFKGIFNPYFIGGHRQGNGAITVRTQSGWSAPVFYKMRGGFGLEPTASPANYLLVFMSRDSIRDIANGEFDLDRDVTSLAGPIIEGTTSAIPKSKMVYVYSRGKGPFTGAVIDGAKLTARDSVNLDLYGANALALLTEPSESPYKRADSTAPGPSDTSQSAASKPEPAYAAVTRPSLNSTTPPHPQRGRGVKVIVIKIVNDDDDEDDGDDNCNQQVMVVRPQVQTVQPVQTIQPVQPVCAAQPVCAVPGCIRIHQNKL